jgi:betaine-aldehyde dehydrogenase
VETGAGATRKAAAERVDRLVEEAAGYAKALVRGGIPEEPELRDGAYFRPALIEADNVDVPIVQQEVFGPLQTFGWPLTGRPPWRRR